MNDSELQARGASNKETAETASIRCTMTLCEENKGAQITAAEDILSTHLDFRPNLHLAAAAIHTLLQRSQTLPGTTGDECGVLFTLT